MNDNDLNMPAPTLAFQPRGEWLEIKVPEQWNGLKMRAVLEHGLGMGAKLAHRLLQEGKIRIHNQTAHGHIVCKTGDRLMVHLFIEEEVELEPDSTAVDIIYEDEHLEVVNKPSGIAVHPNDPEDRGTLLHRVFFHHLVEGAVYRPRPIHRLDEDTSGGVLFAKHDWAKVKLDAALRDGLVKREYVAVIEGHLPKRKGTIHHPIGRDRHHPTRRRVSPNGQEAITHYEVIETFERDSLVSLKLETGRTHQIRVHLSHLGHPVMGDTLYGGSAKSIKRQALHGARLIFSHPISNQLLDLEIPWAEDFTELVDRLRSS